MPMTAFVVGLDALAEWETADYEWMAVTAGTPDITVDTVADLLAGDVIEATAVSRIPVDTRVRLVDDVTNLISYGADDPSWPAPGGGETITGIVLIKVVTADVDSIPVAAWAVTPTPSDITDPLVFALPDGLVAYVTQAA
jgi:hypothetical protein